MPTPATPTGPRATSRAARPSAAHCSRLHGLILAALGTRGHHGATDHEIAGDLWYWKFRSETVRARRVELVRAGQVRDSGRTRPTPSGRRAVVWVREWC